MKSFVNLGVITWVILIFFPYITRADFRPNSYFENKIDSGNKIDSEKKEWQNESNKRLALVQSCGCELHESKKDCFHQANTHKKELGSCLRDGALDKKICSRGVEDETEIETIRVEVLPASVLVFTFEQLGISGDALIASVADGGLDVGVIEAKVVDNRLVVATPGDVGEDQIFSVQISSSLAKIYLELVVKSTRLLSVASVSEADEEGNTIEAPPLVVEGLPLGNVFSDQEILIYVDGAPPLDEVESRLFLIAENGAVFNLADFSTFDQSTNRFAIARRELADLLGIIPLGEYEFTVNLVSEDFTFTHTYSFTVFRSGVTVTGQLVDENGQALSGAFIDDLNLAVVGNNSNIRRVVNIDESGQFIISDLLIETYSLVVTDLQQPNVFTSALTIFPGSTHVQVNVLYRDGVIMPSPSTP